MGDLIRREDIDKAIQSICDLCGEDKKNNGVMCGACNLDSFIREYEDLPSAEPERKKGKLKTVGFLTCQCTECGAQFHELEYTNFCPNCGADMRGE